MATKKVQSAAVSIPAPMIKDAVIRIKGDTPIIFHKWSEKQKKMMRDKQMKIATAGKEARDPESEYLDSFYHDQDGFIAFKANALKQALVGSARVIDGIAMTELRAGLFVVGDSLGMIPLLIKGKRIKPTKLSSRVDGDEIYAVDTKVPEIKMREDTVTVGMGSADLRYRGQVENWEMIFTIRFLANRFSLEQVVNLVQYAGFTCGLGEWRPEKNGTSGTFSVVSTG